MIDIRKDAAKIILEHANCFRWTVQGLGMMRMYLSDKVRLHVWHDSLISDNVSKLHTHPWDLKSNIIAGSIKDTVYKISENKSGSLCYKQKILCGENGGLVGKPKKVKLVPVSSMLHRNQYSLNKNQIHFSTPENGTVSLIERVFYSDTEHAYVFWPLENEWGSAEPRPATQEEVLRISTYALNKYFK